MVFKPNKSSFTDISKNDDSNTASDEHSESKDDEKANEDSKSPSLNPLSLQMPQAFKVWAP